MNPKLQELLSSRDDIFMLDDTGKGRLEVEVIPFDNLALDRVVLGIGGVPCGRIIEIYAKEGVGKTTALIHLIASAQRMGLEAALVDVEHAFDPTYAESLGVDLSRMLISQPNSGEDALDVVELLIKSGAVRLIGIDSVAALTPKAELEGEMGDQQMGAQARLMGKAMRKLTAIAAEHGVAVVFLNQIRQKIGVMFGNPDVTPGGNALKFFASMRIELTTIETLKNGEERYGHRVRATCVKNKLCAPFGKTVVDFIVGRGFDQARTLLDLGAKYTDVVKLKGAKWTVDGKTLPGRAAAASYLDSNPDVAERVSAAITAALDGEVVGVEEEEEEETVSPDTVEAPAPEDAK